MFKESRSVVSTTPGFGDHADQQELQRSPQKIRIERCDRGRVSLACTPDSAGPNARVFQGPPPLPPSLSVPTIWVFSEEIPCAVPACRSKSGKRARFDLVKRQLRPHGNHWF